MTAWCMASFTRFQAYTCFSTQLRREGCLLVLSIHMQSIYWIADTFGTPGNLGEGADMADVCWKMWKKRCKSDWLWKSACVLSQKWSTMPLRSGCLSQLRLQPRPREVHWGLMFLRQWKASDERPCVSIKYHHEAGGFYFSLLIVLLTVHTVSLTFLTTLLAPNKKGWARGGGKMGGAGSHIPPLTLIIYNSNAQH